MSARYSRLLRNVEMILLGAIVLAISLFTYWPQLGANLDIRQDDHRIIFFGSSFPPHEQVRDVDGSDGYTIQPSIEWALASDVKSGRFRPFTQVLEIFLPKFIGTDAARWHAILLTLAGITCAALFFAAVEVYGSARVAALFALMVMLGPDPGPARTWYMMSTKAEAVGTLLVAGAVFAASRAALGKYRCAWDGVGLLCAALVGLTKESFVLVIPALAGLRIWLEASESRTTEWESARKLMRLTSIYAGIFLAQSAAIALTLSASSVESYGGATFRSSSVFLDGLVLILRHLPQQSVYFIPVILSAYLMLRSRRAAEALRASAPVLALFALWIIPQVLLYSARGGMWDHYWLPCVIGIAGLNAAALVYLDRSTNRWPFGTALVVVVLWAGNGIRVNFQTVANFAERTRAHQEALSDVVRRTADLGKLLVVADGGVEGEYALSWVFFLAHGGKPSTKVFFYDTRRKYQGQFSRATFFPFAGRLTDVPACQFDAIIFLGQPSEDDFDWKSWYSKGCHEVRVFSRTQRNLSLRHFGWTTGEFKVTVATKAQRMND